MGTKHDVLTEEELSSYQVNPKIIQHLNNWRRRFPDKQSSEINILDWGCGRGRSVAKLRKKGFNAYGVEIEKKTISQGFTLFEKRGLSPTSILKTIDELNSFNNGYFDFIFSEQVLEHIEDLSEVIDEMARLTASGGTGIHHFPSSKIVWEPHLLMPIIHWLPKNILRKYWIALMLLLNLGPIEGWPQMQGKSLMTKADILYEYVNEHTFYRGNEEICKMFEKRGFKCQYDILGNQTRLRKLFPKRLGQNGFPKGRTLLMVTLA